MKKLFALLIISSVLLAACSPPTEKERFTDATVEVACMVFESGNPFDPALEEKTKEIFAGYDFNVENEEEMRGIASKYENDTDVQAAVEAALRECASELFEELSTLEEVISEDAVTEDPAPDAAVVEADVEGEDGEVTTEDGADEE